MNTIAFRVFLLFLLDFAIAIPSVSAELQSSPEIRRKAEIYQKEQYQKNLTGWNGILFYCPIEKQSSHALNEICENGYTNAEFLSASAKINLTRARDGYEVGLMSRISDLLILEIELGATKSGAPSAFHARLRAYVGYSEAVEKSQFEEKKKARGIPRSGDIIFWERTAIGASSGTDKDLVTPMSKAIEQLLKQFFADYLNAQR
ncbi:hypothetical protein NG726_14955 [Pseudomonas sp. MOB-449]|nr:hypothetical protein [Pseudomonas sp. MOB-449]